MNPARYGGLSGDRCKWLNALGCLLGEEGSLLTETLVA
jgi:hypothetical protein